MDFNRMTAAVPVISMSLPADQFAKDFGASFERFGFAMITDHGIDPALIDEAWAKAKAFFALPEEVKRAYHIAGGGGARGYTPFGTEIAKGAMRLSIGWDTNQSDISRFLEVWKRVYQKLGRERRERAA